MLNQYLKNPRNTGMVVASSAGLAKAMSHNCHNYNKVLEIGAGSGAITKELVKKVIPDKLLVFEHSSVLCKKLKKTVLNKMPHVLKEGPAQSYISEILKEKNAIIVSSLPFKSLPPPVAKELIDLLCAFALNEGCVVRQYSYLMPLILKPPFDIKEGLEWKKITTVYANIPPAQVWELRKK